MHPKLQILLPDCNLRKCFDVFNCLSHLGYFVVPAAEKPSFGVGLLYGRKVFRLRKSDFASFTNDLNEIMHHFSGYRIVFLPTEEDTVLLFMEYIDQYGKGSFVFALPDRNSFELVRNKRSLSRYCHSVNISCPKELNVNDLNRNFCRAIAKPCIGSGGRGHVHIDRLSDLESIREIENDFIIQELLPDFRHVQGGFFLFDKGKLVSYYGHIRLRTFPISAGVTVFSKIVYSKQIKNLGNDLLQRLNWNGLAMIEFLFNPTTKEYDVIEVNPRLWGSFLLSEFAETGLSEN
jgi:predicted ATP-grasp superfamily ATP-dependent carboligase